MRKQFALLVILLSIVFSSFNIVCRILPVAHATYVEGGITQDTIWTLVDSPFVLSNNVIVNSGVTLMIEPGVQVRFGGEFSLIVNGRIIANGTEERTIHFTTNDPTEQIPWQTIAIRGPEPSLFNNCLIECGTNGTTLDGGLLDIEKSIIRANVESGISVNSGTLTIQDSTIANNSNGTAITIAGGNQVDISKNIIKANGNGLRLLRSLAGTISIRQNEISFNNGAGIVLQADTFVNTAITENNIFANGYGFLVGANTSTYISRNYIFNNTVGIYYTGESYHFADFNDIYDNGIGMDLDSTSGLLVSAPHNYWGDKTGPRHDSLNPHARGNSVKGDGVDIDFLPFLTHSFTYSNIPPTAVLWTDKISVTPYQTVTFIGTDSQDDGSVNQYFFDFNDGANSGWTSLSLWNHSYSSTGTYTPSLVVQDDFGSTSTTATATINVLNTIPLETSVTLNNSTIPFNGETWVTVYVSTATGGVANADVTLLSVRGGTFEPQTGLTDGNGYFTTKFTAPNVTQTTDVRIIARASMMGYADGSDYEYVRVLSPLEIHVVPETTTIWSEETIVLDIQVTNSFDEPVAGVYLALSCSNGNLSAITGITDSYGKAAFMFTAPFTLNQLGVTITVGGSQEEYADSQSETYITVEPKTMVLEVTATPDAVLSEEASTITVRATFGSTPISNATVTISSDAGGNFSETMQSTDMAGISRFAFTAPRTSAVEGINVTIMATAVKDGYVDAENRMIIAVKPKEMSLEITPTSDVAFSGGGLNVTVHAEYNRTSLQDVNVAIGATNGTFSQTTGTTDASGNVTFSFTAPQVYEPFNVTFSATATKDGYLEATKQLDMPVNPRTFVLTVIPSTVRSGQDEILTIHATCKEDASPADAALITMSYGGREPLANITDPTGTCTFIINAPQAPNNQLNITLTAERIGYWGKQAIVTLNVLPGEGGISWITILIIAIPIAVAVVVAVLIKMKVIVVSSKEEETGSE